MFYLFAETSWYARQAAAAADSPDADHDGHRLILTQIIVERARLWEAIMFPDGGRSTGPLDRKINRMRGMNLEFRTSPLPVRCRFLGMPIVAMWSSPDRTCGSA
jgi:hypothetical protein